MIELFSMNEETKRYEVDPVRGSILKGMIRFSLPISASTLLTMLFSFADTIVIGRFGHANAISAIGVSASILNLLVGGLTELSSGVTVTAGRYYGENRPEKVSRLLHSLPLSALLPGSLISIAAILSSRMILRFLNCPDKILADAVLYFRIYFLGVPLTVMSTFLASVLQARGNSFIPFFFQISAAVLNILLNLFFVIVFDWNVAGVGAATVISQVVLAVMFLVFLCGREDELKLDLKKLTLFSGMKQVFSIGIPASMEGIILNLSGVIIASAVNRFDTPVIAGNTIATTIEGLMVLTFVGFASASTVYISQNYGAKEKERVRNTFLITISTVFLAAEAVGVLLYLFADPLASLFTSERAIVECAKSRMFYMCLFFGFCGTMNVVSGCERGLGDAKTPLYISLFCSVAFRLTWILTYARAAGTVESIYISFPICWILCTVLNVIAFRRIYRIKMKEL